MQKLQIQQGLYTWAFQLGIWETSKNVQHISASKTIAIKKKVPNLESDNRTSSTVTLDKFVSFSGLALLIYEVETQCLSCKHQMMSIIGLVSSKDSKYNRLLSMKILHVMIENEPAYPSTPFLIWNQSIVSCPVLTIAS